MLSLAFCCLLKSILQNLFILEKPFMRRLVSLIAFCIVACLLVLFGNSFSNKSQALTTIAPVAVDDGPYIIREPTGMGNVYGKVDSPGFLANDSWDTSENLNYYWQLPGPKHSAYHTYNGWGGFHFWSSGTYTGYDSFSYELNYIPYTVGAFDIGSISVIIINSDGAEDAGEMCEFPPKKEVKPANHVGEPVNVTNGNMWLKQKDYKLPGLGENIEINRFYNSIIQTTGLFGKGWSTKYDESLVVYAEDEHQDEQTNETYHHQMLRLNMPDGRAVYFGRGNRNDVFKPALMGVYGQIVKNFDSSYTLTFKDGRVHQFSSAGKLLWQKDRNGNQTTLSYNGSGNLTGVTDAFSRTLTITPNTNGTVASISDSIGTIATYEYYSSNNSLLKTVTYNDGSKYKFEYDSNNNKVKTVKDALDNILETHDYDSSGRATTSEKHGGVEKYTLDYSHWGDSVPYTQVTDANQKVSKYYFDKSKGRNLITKIEGVCGCGGSGSEVTTYEYDMALNLVKTTDALSHETVYTYDGNGNRLTMHDTLGTETYTYNSFGQMLDRTDRLNILSRRHYNLSGNLTSFENEQGKETIYTYTSLGQVESVTNALGRTTSITYDSQGRITRITDANNKDTDFTYDARARLTSRTNALNHTTSYEYDLNNRLNKITYPDTTFISCDYDLAGRRTSVTDERSNTKTYAFDGAYRLTSVTDALNHTQSLEYDLMSNITSVTDALNHTTDYEYDDFNRLKKIIHPPATTGATRLEERTEYNLVGNVKKRIDTANRETVFDYDAANRLIKTTDPLSQITQVEYNARSEKTKVKDALNQEYTFTYDEVGRQLSQTRAGSTMTFDYDAVGNRVYRSDYLGRITYYVYDNLNRLTNINYDGSSNFAVYTYDDASRMVEAGNQVGIVTLEYDNRNRLTYIKDVFSTANVYSYDASGNRTAMTLGGQTHASYTYDAVNRLTELTDESNNNYTFSYDAANRLTTKTLPNGVETVYNYDNINRLTRLKHQTSTTTLFDNQYVYNTAQQISQIAELAQTRNFTYDNTDRLTNVANPTNSIENFSYDGVGNRTLSHLSGFYTYDPFNRLKDTDSFSYDYDANGNRVSKSTYQDPNSTITPVIDVTRYDWDEENRLIWASTSDLGEVFYQYDALGRRVKRINGEKGETAFTYDGLDVVMDDDTNEGITTYQNAPGIDNKLKLKHKNANQYFLADHLGSTVGLANSSGALSDVTSYDSFGNATNRSFATRYQFTGREFDESTGLYYYRARWYDPQIGRFISEDPIKFKGGINWFAYVKNNPVKFIDPLGLCPKDTPCDGENSPKLWNKPQFGEGPYTNQNPFTSIESGTPPSADDSSDTAGYGFFYYCYMGIKGLFGDLGARGAGGGVPGGSEMINTLEIGPELYNTLDTIDRRNQDIKDAQRCAEGGDCTPSPYEKGNGLGHW
jgi:RHS repeat-associated protein